MGIDHVPVLMFPMDGGMTEVEFEHLVEWLNDHPDTESVYLEESIHSEFELDDVCWLTGYINSVAGWGFCISTHPSNHEGQYKLKKLLEEYAPEAYEFELYPTEYGVLTI